MDRGGEGKLPWRAPELKGAKFAEKVVWNGVLDSVPLYRNNVIIGPSNREPQAPSSASSTSSVLLPSIITATTAVAAVAGYLLYASLGKEPENRRLSDMGEAGALFAGLGFGSPETEQRGRRPVAEDTVPVGFEVDVAVEENK